MVERPRYDYLDGLVEGLKGQVTAVAGGTEDRRQDETRKMSAIAGW